MAGRHCGNAGMPVALSLLAGFILLVVSAGAQRSAPNAAAPQSPAGSQPVSGTLQARDARYHLAKSDVVEVQFTFSPEFNQTLTVQPDGYISLKGAGEVLAEGSTLAELARAIVTAYRGILHDPLVSVSLKEFDKPFFLASGQVGRPGKYELRGDTSLSEALAIAGGLTEAAKHSQVVLFRRVTRDTVEARVYDVKRMLNSRRRNEDPRLSPGDMVYVPQSAWSKVRRYLPASTLGVYATPNPF